MHAKNKCQKVKDIGVHDCFEPFGDLYSCFWILYTQEKKPNYTFYDWDICKMAFKELLSVRNPFIMDVGDYHNAFECYPD